MSQDDVNAFVEAAWYGRLDEVEKCIDRGKVTVDAENEDGYTALYSAAELEEAGILNRSAQHVDIVADFRPGGCGRRVLLDDTEVRSADRHWVVG